MPAGLVPERLDPVAALGVADRLVDRAVPPDAARVREQRVGAVQQPELALLVRDRRRPPPWRRRPPSAAVRPGTAGDHPLGVRLGGHRRRVVVALRAATRRRSSVGGGRGDPVHHRGGEVDVLGDPVRQRLVDRGGQLGDHGRGHLAVLGQVVAGQDRDRAGIGGSAGQQSGDQLPGRVAPGRPDRRERRDVGGHRRLGRVEVAVGAAYVAGLGDRDRDDGDLRSAQVVQVRRVVGRRDAPRPGSR